MRWIFSIFYLFIISRALFLIDPDAQFFSTFIQIHQNFIFFFQVGIYDLFSQRILNIFLYGSF